MTRWNFWGEKEFSDVYENIYIRSHIKDWFKIIDKITKVINFQGSKNKLILDIGCGEGHTTKQILDRVKGQYTCDLLEPNKNALLSAKIFLSKENNIGECFSKSLDEFETDRKYDLIFTSHTNYYWSSNKKNYDIQLLKLINLLDKGGKLLILTLPKDSGHYKIMLKEVYPKFNYVEYIVNYYKKINFKVDLSKFKMRIFIGDILTTNNRFDLKVFYKFIHNINYFPNDKDIKKFLKKIKNNQKGGYIDFKDQLIVVSK